MSDHEDVVIMPIMASMIESFHRALDIVARERRYLTLTEAPPLPDTRAFVLNAMAAGDPRFVALLGDEVIGWCDVRRHFFPAHAHRGTLGIGVLPAHRGQGIGARLIRACLDETGHLGFTRIELDVHSDNLRAIALYEKMGFNREGLTRDAALIDGVYRDAIVMSLVDRGAGAPARTLS
ncbi:GNAT family N-acetyltransferase [Lichenifustis flavocetrariae]|uniref:GNAT family N-acetyltransferase n=1 Tax=Lichenifustis flavocetrariae TaxID=2949735 RepID=A0AA42CGJ4_9HYPH|nr:GNAT family protein [Lichenifustis flavocetrariae]MCW6506648.1 GNAT family N-acetyltransferase [Lichenifustis flavocetrariae]